MGQCLTRAHRSHRRVRQDSRVSDVEVATGSSAPETVNVASKDDHDTRVHLEQPPRSPEPRHLRHRSAPRGEALYRASTASSKSSRSYSVSAAHTSVRSVIATSSRFSVTPPTLHEASQAASTRVNMRCSSAISTALRLLLDVQANMSEIELTQSVASIGRMLILAAGTQASEATVEPETALLNHTTHSASMNNVYALFARHSDLRSPASLPSRTLRNQDRTANEDESLPSTNSKTKSLVSSKASATAQSLAVLSKREHAMQQRAERRLKTHQASHSWSPQTSQTSQENPNPESLEASILTHDTIIALTTDREIDHERNAVAVNDYEEVSDQYLEIAVSPPIVRALRHGIDSWDFDIFEFREHVASISHSDDSALYVGLLPVFGAHVLSRPVSFMSNQHTCFTTETTKTLSLGLELFPLDTNEARIELPAKELMHFLWAVEIGYRDKNPYHNSTHAADVAHKSMLLLRQIEVPVHPLDALAVLLAAICHDYAHPGTTNDFLIETEHEVALTYNDQSVLENFSAAQVFRLMRAQPQCDIFSRFNYTERRRIRKTFVSCVLATVYKFTLLFCRRICVRTQRSFSLSVQQTSVTFKKTRLTNVILSQAVQTRRQICFSRHLCTWRTCPTLEWQLCQRWARAIQKEWFIQGELHEEWRQVLVSLEGNDDDIPPVPDMFAKERAASLPQAQMGFADFVVSPLLEAWAAKFPDSGSVLLERLQSNRSRWAAITILGDEDTKRRLLIKISEEDEVDCDSIRMAVVANVRSVMYSTATRSVSCGARNVMI